jgi:hypothetical protein
VSSATYVLLITDVPKSVNAGGGGARAHWGAAHREKKRWEGLFLMELMAQRVRRNMTCCYAEIEVRWKHRNRRDIENYRHPITKPLADALVIGGYLPDDTEEFFKVRDMQFVYPDQWEHADPRLKEALLIRLEALYAAD